VDPQDLRHLPEIGLDEWIERNVAETTSPAILTFLSRLLRGVEFVSLQDDRWLTAINQRIDLPLILWRLLAFQSTGRRRVTNRILPSLAEQNHIS
jgi:hypothetical protein